MNKTEKLTIFFLVALTLLTFCIIIIISYSRASLLKEAFLGGYHNCYPYSSAHNARNSFKSKSKGWCTSGNYGDMPDGDDYSVYNDSTVKCPPNYSRVPAKDSHSYESKAWCAMP